MTELILPPGHRCDLCEHSLFVKNPEGFTVCENCGAVQNGEVPPLATEASQTQRNHIHPFHKNLATCIGNHKQWSLNQQVMRIRKWNRLSSYDPKARKLSDVRRIARDYLNYVKIRDQNIADEVVYLFDEINSLDTSQKTYKSPNPLGYVLTYLKIRGGNREGGLDELFDISGLDRSTLNRTMRELFRLYERFAKLRFKQRSEYRYFPIFMGNLYNYRMDVISNRVFMYRDILFRRLSGEEPPSAQQIQRFIRNVLQFILGGTAGIIAATISRILFAEKVEKERALLEFFGVGYRSVQNQITQLLRDFNFSGFTTLRRSSHLIIKLKRQILLGKPRRNPIPPPQGFLYEYKLEAGRLRIRKLSIRRHMRSRVRRTCVITRFIVYYHKFLQSLYYAYIISILQHAFRIQNFDFNSRVIITGKDPPLILAGG